MVSETILTEMDFDVIYIFYIWLPVVGLRHYIHGFDWTDWGPETILTDIDFHWIVKTQDKVYSNWFWWVELVSETLLTEMDFEVS